jgi:hypothetical protein
VKIDNNIKMDLRVVVHGGVNRIQLEENYVSQRDFVNTILDLLLLLS